MNSKEAIIRENAALMEEKIMLELVRENKELKQQIDRLKKGKSPYGPSYSRYEVAIMVLMGIFIAIPMGFLGVLFADIVREYLTNVHR